MNHFIQIGNVKDTQSLKDTHTVPELTRQETGNVIGSLSGVEPGFIVRVRKLPTEKTPDLEGVTGKFSQTYKGEHPFRRQDEEVTLSHLP